MGAQKKSLLYAPSIPWYKCTLSPVLVVFIAPLLYIQVMYDQAKGLEL